MATMKGTAQRPSTTDPVFEYIWARPEMMEYQQRNEAFSVTLEPTNRCSGSCAYCYSSSTAAEKIEIPRQVMFRLVNEAVQIGVKQIAWAGGCPLAYPAIFDLIEYAVEKGLDQNLVTSGIISREQARRLAHLTKYPVNIGLGIHIDSIVQETYDQVHTNPKSLGAKVQGYRNVLEAGFPPDQIYGIITCTRQIIPSFEETCDWFIDEMGASFLCCVAYKASGFAAEHLDWEAPVSDLKRACEYRAKKCGEHWLKIGPTEVGCLFCNTTFFVNPNGQVRPCPTMHGEEVVAGNIYQESLVEIYRDHKNLLLYNFEVHGPCGSCENNPWCRGCRSNAYHGTGDITASDPQCYLNPMAQEYVYQGRG